jgi:uncharacterized membrane protein YqjE
MAPIDRSFSDVFQDIVRNLQEIVRSEVRLAKTEIREEAERAKSSAMLLGGGAVTGLFAGLFFLLTIMYALVRVMPDWAAAMVVGAVLAVIAGITLSAGAKQLKLIRPTPERTVETIKENVEWVKQQSK